VLRCFASFFYINLTGSMSLPNLLVMLFKIFSMKITVSRFGEKQKAAVPD
jgi:hypothetical protein